MKIHLAIIALLILFPVVCFASDSDIPRNIDNNGPVQSETTLVLKELWRVGGEDSDVIFGRIVDVLQHSNGGIYVLDNQLCQVAIISEDGQQVQYISGEGDGPGELRQPMALAFLDDEVLAVGMGFPGKNVTLKLDGTPLSSLFPIGEPAQGNIGIMMSSKFADGILVSSGGRMVFQDQNTSYTERFLSVGEGDLKEFNRILETRTPIDPTGQRFVETENYYIDMSWALGSHGNIYAPMKRDAYEVSVFDKKGTLLQIFGREYSPRKRSQSEKDEVAPLINVAGRTEGREWEISDYDPCIARIQYNSDDQTVWVLTSNGNNDQPEGILVTYDVFSAEGEYLRQVPIPLGNEMTEGNVYLVGGGRMIVVRGTGSSFGGDTESEEGEEELEAEPQEVICYEIR